MRTIVQQGTNPLDPASVLAKATRTGADRLALPASRLRKIIGEHNPERIDPASKTGELALLLIKVYKGLFAAMGGDTATMRHWLATPNRHLNGVPVDLMESAQGLIRVNDYLSAVSQNGNGFPTPTPN